ncbi:MAG: AI-2E family transporter [Kribbellaceae bacterium]
MSSGPVAPEGDASTSGSTTSVKAQTGEASWALPRGVIVLLGLGGGVLAAAGMRGVADLLAPVFLALILTIAVSPVRAILLRRGAPRWTATIAVLIVVYAILLALAGSLALSVARLATLLPTYEDDFTNLVDNARGWLSDRGIGSSEIETALEQVNLGSLLGVLENWLSGLLGAFSTFAFVVVTLLFMALDGGQFPQRLRVIGQARPEVATALASFAHGTVRYLLVSTIFGLIVASIDVAVLYALGIPLPLLWGLLAFITNYIPNIGFVIGVIPPALLGLLDGGVSTMLWVIVSYCVINFVIQSVIQPKVVGDAVGLSTTLTFLSLVFWTWVLGPLGAVLAIPLSLLVKALLVDVDPSTQWLDGLLAGGHMGDEPAPAEPSPEPSPEPTPEPAAPAPAAAMTEQP